MSKVEVCQTAGKNFSRKKLARFAEKLMKKFAIKGDLSIVVVGNRKMRSLNKRFLGKDFSTDVLTFPLGEISEIYISANEAKNSKNFSRQVAWLAAHGILHLAGFSDKTALERKKMMELQDLLLKNFFK